MRPKIILYTSIAIVAVMLLYVYYLYNKPHRNVSAEEATQSETAANLFKKFSENEQTANEMYLDKVVRVRGKVKEISKDDKGNTVVILETGDPAGGINCTFDEKEKSKTFKKEENIEVKGLCTGMLMDVVLIKCTLIQ